ncbi:MAG: SMI1/KNR4 family protein [Armatimonadota bacterium]
MTTDAYRFEWIRPITRRGESYPPPETEAELDVAQGLLGSSLPASYRAFARRFGLGGRLHTLPELFRLMPISGKREPHWSDSVVDAARFWRSPTAIEDNLPAEFLRQAIVFAVDEGALTFLFHTGEVTDPAAPEYRIYQIPRHQGPEPICASFEEWLRWVHKGYDPASWGDEDDEDDAQDPPADRTMPYARFPL